MSDAPVYDRPRPLSEHLEELAVRLRRCLAAVVVIGALAAVVPVDTEYYVPLVSVVPQELIDYVLPDVVEWRGRVIEVHIAQYNPFAGFNILLKTALLLGLLGASPLIAYEAYAFLAPALYPWERRRVARLAAVGAVLFAAGVALAFTSVMPVAFRFMIVTSAAVAGDNQLVAFSDVEQLFTTIVLIAVATGVALETPLIVYLLVSTGVIDAEWLTGDNKKYLLLASLLIGAAISPDPSGIGMLVIGAVMYASILAAARLGARARAEGGTRGHSDSG